MIIYGNLSNELTLDPLGFGFNAYILSGSHENMARLLNEKSFPGETVISIDKLEDYMLSNGKIIEIEEVASVNGPAQNAAKLILRLLSSRLTTFKFEEPAVQNVLDILIAENVIDQNNKTEISQLAPQKMLSRAEVLFGENTVIRHEDIAIALRRD